MKRSGGIRRLRSSLLKILGLSVDGQPKQDVFEMTYITATHTHAHIPFLITAKTDKKVDVLKRNEFK